MDEKKKKPDKDNYFPTDSDTVYVEKGIWAGDGNFSENSFGKAVKNDARRMDKKGIRERR